MRQWIKATMALCASLGAAAAMAAPVSLGTIEHLYGTDGGRQLSSIMGVYHPGGNCDVANPGSITVKATSAATCNRFDDIFDFSGIDFAGIDHFSVTLTFSGARNQLLTFERWDVLGSYDYVQSGNSFGTLNASGPQTFTFDGSKALFNQIVGAEKFFLSFSTTGGSAMTFDLTSAKLEIFGTAAAVPEPGSLALAGLSLALLGGMRRARKTIAS